MGCGFPGAPAHSTVTFSSDSIGPGTVATYSCDRGFELLGPAHKECQGNSTWTPAGIPFCGECDIQPRHGPARSGHTPAAEKRRTFFTCRIPRRGHQE